MEFLVEFELEVPEGTPESEIEQRTRAESVATARLADQGHLHRIWRRAAVANDGLGPRPLQCRERERARRTAACAASGRLAAGHDHSARAASERSEPGHAVNGLPEPRLTLVYRLEATLGEPLDLGDVSQGHRRIVPQTGGTFAGRS